MNDDEIYKTAQSLASDLAEDDAAARIAEMFIENSREKAAGVRARSEAKRAWLGTSNIEDQYHLDQSAIYGAIYSLLRGYKGWKLVREAAP